MAKDEELISEWLRNNEVNRAKRPAAVIGADYMKKWGQSRLSGQWRDDPEYKPKKKKRRRK